MPYLVIDPAAAEPAPVLTVGAPHTSDGETLATMRSELFYQLGGRDDLTDDRLDKLINWAYLDLWTSLKLDESQSSYGFNTVPGQALYALPYQVRSTLGAAIVDQTSAYGGVPLEKIDLTAYRRLEVASGPPRQFFRSDRVLVLYPTPDQIYPAIVDFRLRPAPLVADTDSPVLGHEWHETILLNARKKGFSALQEFDKAMPANNDFIDHVRRREDPSADEDTDRVVGSSVPRSARMLNRTRRFHREPE